MNITIRPEQAILTEDTGSADLTGTVTNVLYSGTDSQFHIKLTSNEEFVAKVQNSGSSRRDWEAGQTLGIKFQPGAAQILRD